MPQPIKSTKKLHVIEISQSTQSMATAYKLVPGKLPKFSIFLELFSNSNENERFPSLSEEELANLGSKTKTPPRVQNLSERTCSIAKQESWKIL